MASPGLEWQGQGLIPAS